MEIDLYNITPRHVERAKAEVLRWEQLYRQHQHTKIDSTLLARQHDTVQQLKQDLLRRQNTVESLEKEMRLRQGEIRRFRRLFWLLRTLRSPNKAILLGLLCLFLILQRYFS
jgi:hypothetical protein